MILPLPDSHSFQYTHPMATSCRDVTFFLILGALALALASLGGPENVGWTSYADKTTDVEGSFAHRAYVVTGVEGSADVYDREFHYDDSDTCGIDFCDKCHTAGRASMAIIILTAIINVGALVLAYLRMESGTAGRVRVAVRRAEILVSITALFTLFDSPPFPPLTPVLVRNLHRRISRWNSSMAKLSLRY